MKTNGQRKVCIKLKELNKQYQQSNKKIVEKKKEKWKKRKKRIKKMWQLKHVYFIKLSNLCYLYV